MLAELLELAPSGVEEVAIGEDVIEYAVYGAPGEIPILPDLKAAAGEALIAVSTSEVADDWAERWREFHKPVLVGGRVTVRPPWEPPAQTAIDLVIDPAQAFGTGAHATTRLCLELMLEIPARGSFVDLGCGSGVLAIAAARLGFQPVLALDNDPASLSATAANAARNGVEVEIRRHDLRVDASPPAVTVAGNLVAPLLRTWATGLAEDGALPRQVIAGGLLQGELDEIADAFARVGLAEEARRSAAGWGALLLRQSGRGQ